MMNHPFIQLTICRLRETWRTPEAIFWVFVFPLVMVVALGLAFRNAPVTVITIDVQDSSGGQELAETLKADERFDVHFSSPEEATRRLRTGKTELIVSADGDAFHFQSNPTRPDSLLARDRANNVLQEAAGRKDLVSVTDEELTEVGTRYIDFLVPGLIGMGLMGGGLWGVGFAVTDMRIRQLLKRYKGTPMNQSHFLGAMLASRQVFMIPEILFIIFIAWVLFGVVSQGGYALVLLIVVLTSFEFAGIGLLVASRAKTLEAVSGLMNLVMVPMWICSGIFFSPDRFPEVAQPIIRIMPLTPVIHSLRQVMLEGAGFTDILPSLAIIITWAFATFFLALKLFRWE